jgi:anti-anti-sigma regulatory factor
LPHGEIVRLPKVVAPTASAIRTSSVAALLRPTLEVFRMHAAARKEHHVLVAPERLVSSTRTEFRAVALAHLERLGAEDRSLIIDLGQTVELDASGLGILVLIQKRAKERGLSTCLRRTPERVRNLLQLTMLDFLFEYVD